MARNELAVSEGLGKFYYNILNSKGDETEWKYGGKLISFALNPSTSTASVFAGDEEVIASDSLSVSGTIGIPSVTDEMMCDVMGFEMRDGAVIYNANKVKPYVKIGIVTHLYGDVKEYSTILKCKLDLPSKQGNTRTETKTFGTAELAFKALILESGDWMEIAASDAEDFKIPEFPVEGEIKGKTYLYYGVIPKLILGETSLTEVTADMIKRAIGAGTVYKVTSKEKSHVSMGVAGKGDVFIALVPSGKTAKKDNGVGSPTTFTGATGSETVEIEGQTLNIYGESVLASNTELFLTVE